VEHYWVAIKAAMCVWGIKEFRSGLPCLAREGGMGAGSGKFLKSVCLEVHSVQLFTWKDNSESQMHIKNLCTKSTQHKLILEVMDDLCWALAYFENPALRETVVKSLLFAFLD